MVFLFQPQKLIFLNTRRSRFPFRRWFPEKKTGGSLEGIFDLAPGCADTDISVNHDAYLYGEAPL